MLRHPMAQSKAGHTVHDGGYWRKMDANPTPNFSDKTTARQHLRGTLSAFDRGAYDGLSRDLRTRLRAHLEENLDLLEHISS